MKNKPSVKIGGALLHRRTLRQTQGALALAVLTCAAAFGQNPTKHEAKYQIEFTQLVDSTGDFNSFGAFPAINNRGDVAFTANHHGDPGVFRVREETAAVATIASNSRDSLSSFGADVAINPAGAVAFGATTSTGSRAIFKSDGNSRTTLIADSTAAGFFNQGVGSPSIDSAGTVAFSAAFAQRGLPGGIFTGNGSLLTTIAITSPGGFASFGNVAINSSGEVVFPATLSDTSKGVFALAGGLQKIVDSNAHPEIDFLGDPVVNESGTVADVAFVLPLDAPEIFTIKGGRFTPRNNPANSPFINSEHPSLNNSGAVAFAAIPLFPGGTDPSDIFLEVSGGESLIPVIKPGDKLFGSTVDHVDLGRFALNDRLQMAFSYALTDGRSGIAIASFKGERE